MRGAIVLAGLAVVLIGAGVFVSLPRTPAKERLAAVTVQLVSSRVTASTGGRKQLVATVYIQSPRTMDECLHFALDEPFAQQTLKVIDHPGGCVRPTAFADRATLVLDPLDDIDTFIPNHAILWGAGGDCGWMGFLGLCSVDVVGQVRVRFPVRSVVPTLRPGYTFGPLVPFPTFDMDQFDS